MAERATNKTAEAIVICQSPDICKTPMGPNLVPVPYPIIAKFDSSQLTAGQTNFEGNAVFHMGSYLPNVQGDEAGVGGGVTSGVNMGCCKPVEHSSTLRVEGQWVVRHGDMMDMNCAGPKGVGNTKGRIIFLAMLKQARVNPDGSIEYIGQQQTKDADANTVTEQVYVKQSADGQIEAAASRQTTVDAAGNITQQESSFQFDENGNLSQADLNTSQSTASLDSRGPVLGGDAIGRTTADGRTDSGDGMYGPANGGASSSSSTPLQSSDARPTSSSPAADPASDPDYQAAQREAVEAQAEIDATNREIAWEAAKAAADVAGLADPTPVSDVISGGMSLAEGDWLGAGLSLISVVPYLGDALAKPAKAAKAAAKGAKLAAKLEKAAAKLKKAKEAAEAALKKAKDALKSGKKAEKIEEGAETVAKAGDGAVIKGKLRGSEVPLAEMKKKKVDYKKRPDAEREKLRSEFNSKGRKDFLKDTAADPDKVAQMKQAGLTDADIGKMQDGLVPAGYQVHHKFPLDDGGTNAADNLILIKNDPYHQALTNMQKELTSGMKAGDARSIDWPVPEGFIYPP
jgi:hypothetical protein